MKAHTVSKVNVQLNMLYGVLCVFRLLVVPAVLQYTAVANQDKCL